MAILQELLARFTYGGILAGLLLGGLGLPIPEEVPILAAGVLSHEGLARWWLALPVCFLGVLSGDVVLYWTGRRWGGRVLGWLEGQGQVVYTATDAQPIARGTGAAWQIAAGRLAPSEALAQGAA